MNYKYYTNTQLWKLIYTWKLFEVFLCSIQNAPPPHPIDPLVTYKYMSLQACLKDQRRVVIYDASENVTICLKISVWVGVGVGVSSTNRYLVFYHFQGFDKRIRIVQTRAVSKGSLSYPKRQPIKINQSSNFPIKNMLW